MLLKTFRSIPPIDGLNEASLCYFLLPADGLEDSESCPQLVGPFLFSPLDVGELTELPADSLEPSRVLVQPEAIGFPWFCRLPGRNFRFTSSSLVFPTSIFCSRDVCKVSFTGDVPSSPGSCNGVLRVRGAGFRYFLASDVMSGF